MMQMGAKPGQPAAGPTGAQPPAGMMGTPHQDLINQVAQQPQGGPNDLLKFIFSHPGFLTDYQKDVIRAWMQNPSAGDAAMNEDVGESSTGTPPTQPGTPGAATAGQPAPTGPAQPLNPVGQVKPA